MDRNLLRNISFLLLCMYIGIYCQPIENNNNTFTIKPQDNISFKYSTNAQNLRLKSNVNPIKIKPIRPIKPCALHHGDCSEEALEVVYKLEQRRRFGDDGKQ